jgi:hypothetical protein
MGILSSAVVIALSGVSCLSVSDGSRMVVPQVQSENRAADGSHGATFTPREIQIPASTDMSIDETGTSDAVTSDGEGGKGKQ